MSSSKEDIGGSDLQRYPSKRGREINKVWDKGLIRQSIPLPPKPDNTSCRNSYNDDYIEPTRDSPPPRYSQVEPDTDSLSYADRSLNTRTWKKPFGITPLSEEDEKRGLVSASKVNSGAILAGDNIGFIDDDYLHPRDTQPDQSEYENTNPRNPPLEAPVYLALRSDTPPSTPAPPVPLQTGEKGEMEEGKADSNGDNKSSDRPESVAIYAIEDSGLCTKM